MGAVLLLWDIDHTLTENNGVNKETYALAFELLTGRPAVHTARTEGRTEPEIMRGMLADHRIEPTREHAARMPGALAAACQAGCPRTDFRLRALPQVSGTLSHALSSQDVTLIVVGGLVLVAAVVLTAIWADSERRKVAFDVLDRLWPKGK